MWAFLGLLVIFLVVNLALIASGIGIGFLIRWVLPSVDPGAGILIGIVSIGLSSHYLLRILSLGELGEFPDGEDDDLGAPLIVYPRSSSRSGRKRKHR